MDSARKLLTCDMENLKIKPDERTMTAVLSAFRNAGLIDEDRMFLNNMIDQYGIRPKIHPTVSQVVLDIDEKAIQLLHHSEKLALAFGLLRTSPTSKLRTVKT
ncbi:hypothetical protein L6164_031887 [Bauhinia variegata]|uniref:Uncharacterized protein n=1 Tax=Bauhinia variegata TaxID=167791 RepID=A0ACB9KLV4_BAUVA|nr:hypothetical protein L6164_031887 [Bauhinia variegata]